MSFARTLLAGSALSLMALGSGHAATLTNTNAIANFSGNECQGGFQTCFAFRTTTGTPVGGGTTTGTLPGNALDSSRAVIKFDSPQTNGSTPVVGDRATTGFANVTASDFTLTFNSTANTLAYTYSDTSTLMTYIVVNQANQSYLFYNAAGFTADTFALTSMFPSNPGYSHITFFDSAGGPGGIPGVPEPASLALLGAGLLGLGAVRRRRRA